MAEAARQAVRGERYYSGGLDPEQIHHALTAGLYHLEAGARAFVDWSASMIEDFGESIRPQLPDLYRRLFDAPAVSHLREQMTPPERSAGHDATATDDSRGILQARSRLGPQKIESAPQAVRVPQITLPRHSGGMVEALRSWWTSAKSGLAGRLKEKAGEMIVNTDKLKQFKEGENALHHFQALAALPEIYENSLPVFRHVDRAAKSEVIYERRYAWVDFPDGKRRHVLLTMRLYPDPAMPRGLYSLEALGLEIHEAALTYSSPPARGTRDDIDQATASYHLNLFLSGIKPEHAWQGEGHVPGEPSSPSGTPPGDPTGENVRTDDSRTGAGSSGAAPLRLPKTPGKPLPAGSPVSDALPKNLPEELADAGPILDAAHGDGLLLRGMPLQLKPIPGKSKSLPVGGRYASRIGPDGKVAASGIQSILMHPIRSRPCCMKQVIR